MATIRHAATCLVIGLALSVLIPLAALLAWDVWPASPRGYVHLDGTRVSVAECVSWGYLSACRLVQSDPRYAEFLAGPTQPGARALPVWVAERGAVRADERLPEHFGYFDDAGVAIGWPMRAAIVWRNRLPLKMAFVRGEARPAPPRPDLTDIATSSGLRSLTSGLAFKDLRVSGCVANSIAHAAAVWVAWAGLRRRRSHRAAADGARDADPTVAGSG